MPVWNACARVPDHEYSGFWLHGQKRLYIAIARPGGDRRHSKTFCDTVARLSTNFCLVFVKKSVTPPHARMLTYEHNLDDRERRRARILNTLTWVSLLVKLMADSRLLAFTKTFITHSIHIRITPSKKYVSHDEHGKGWVHSYDPSRKP